MGKRGSDAPERGRSEQIYGHAARMFVERGFAATSMGDIALAVGITKAGLYHFVASKEDMLFNLMMWSMDTLDAEVTEPARMRADPLDRLVFLVHAHLRNIGTHNVDGGNPLTIIVDEPAGLSPERSAIVRGRKAAYYRFVRECLVALRHDGRLHDLDPSVATFSILGMIVWFARWYRPTGPLSLEAIIADMAQVALRGVVRPEALERHRNSSEVAHASA